MHFVTAAHQLAWMKHPAIWLCESCAILWRVLRVVRSPLVRTGVLLRSVPGHVVGVIAALVAVLVVLIPGAWAQVNVQGKWSTLPYLMPINPVHVALMYNGKVLVVSGSGNDATNTKLRAAVWDPIAGTVTVQTVAWDMFCNGMVVLPDGRPFVIGGTLQYDPFWGQPKTSVFDPATNTFTDVQNMAHGRWYPTATTLGDGRVMTFSGANETGGGNKAVEIYTVGSGWSAEFIASWTPPLYPRMHLLPNGKVFYSGASITSRIFDPTAHTWTTVGNTIYGNSRTYGSSVLMPLTPANNYDPQVIIMGGGSPATATTEVIDLGASNPLWQSGPSMSQGRIEMNAVILPNGKVLAVGGSLNDEQASSASLNADLYNPGDNTFTIMAANAYPRLYHSNALLLPDATVWLAGGNPARGTYEQHMEIYSPPYLFNANGTAATRPTITGAPAAIAWGGSFTVSTPDAANISSVVLVRPGAPTHAFDMDQRLVGLSFTQGLGTLTVTAPPNGNIAPPGYYMLFLLNSSGVPSVAKFTKLSATAPVPAPTVTSITPSTGPISGGGSLTIAGTGFRAGATVTIGGTAATNVVVVSSTSITATAAPHSAGTASVVVTNSDGQSGTLNNGFTYTTSPTTPVLNAFSPLDGASVSSPFWVRVNAASAMRITGMIVYLDGVTIYVTTQSFVDAVLPLTSGTHRVTVRAWNNMGQFGTYTASIQGVGSTSTVPLLQVFSPGNNTLVPSPLLVRVNATSTAGITGIIVYIDSVPKFTTTAASVDQTFPVGAGTHFVTVRGWNSKGEFSTYQARIGVP